MREPEHLPAKRDTDVPPVDLTGLYLDAVLGADDSVLARSMRRVLRDLDRPEESYAAHGNTP